LSANPIAMAVRVTPVALVLAAVAADALAHPLLAFYLLVASVPAAAVCALSLFGRLVELPGGARGISVARLEAFLASLGLVFVLVAAAARGQAPDAAALPALTASAIVAALVVYGAQSLMALIVPRPRV
jgi:hypothetical protein